jgi:hypothetical protein
MSKGSAAQEPADDTSHWGRPDQLAGGPLREVKPAPVGRIESALRLSPFVNLGRFG